MPEIQFDMKKLGLQISILRNVRHMSQEELAEKCDVSRNTVASWESGQKELKLFSFLKLALALDCPVQELLKGMLPEETVADQDEGVELCNEARSRLSHKDYHAFIKQMKATLDFISEIKAS
ncbi:MAG: helix-turn-helix transcriptional regulator [Clostridia bacterium]|nr:helix-turn-helix transcriptional regulator [Clostridia bacterium]